ncbi:Cleavage stimulation factor subunit 2 [Cucumispora dikerogammari]|nr:Cleavage stimulation factor subunit 2 [Cucumispora dikerogammari]
MKEQKGNTVFVGNIDFEIPESDIIKELETIGKVISFRLIYDKNTGKSKGYGFCEYENPTIAQTALKTLRINFNGRPVKINPSDYGLTSSNINTNTTNTDFVAKKVLPSEYFKLETNMLGIKLALESFDKTYLSNFLLLVKSLIQQEIIEFVQLCVNYPEFPYLLIQTMLNLNLIKHNEVKSIIKDSFSVPGNLNIFKERIKEININSDNIMNDVVKEKFVSLGDLLKDEVDNYSDVIN